MNTQRIGTLFFALFALLGLFSCGGGGNDNVADSGGTGGTGMAMGTITGFGSIYVNGVRYDTTQAQVSVEGTAADANVLKLGMVVTVVYERTADGQISAKAVDYRKKLLGPVTSVTATGIQVLGQDVRVASTTVFDGFTLLTELTNQLAEVSGYQDVNGQLLASRIEAKGAYAGGEVELKGTVSTVTGGSFTIGGLTVNYATPPAEGAYVKVKGTLAGSVLTATEVETEHGGISGNEDDEVEIEGVVMARNGDELTLEGETVRFTASTQVEGGTLADIQPGLRIEVEGALDAAGRIVAESVELKNEGDMSFSGDVQTVTATGFTLMGVNVTVDENTIVNDKARFLSELTGGTWLEVHAYREGNSMIATKIEASSPGEYELEGTVDAGSVEADTRRFSIAGFTVSAPNLALTLPSEGQRVEVEGSAWSEPAGLNATTIESDN